MPLRLCSLLLLLASTSLAHAAEPVYDVVIYGGTSAGVAAAVQTARQGKTAIVIEPSRHLGGLTAAGLGATDIGNKAAIGGVSREFYQRLKEHYRDPAHWTRESRDAFRGSGHNPNEDAAWTFEPHVAEALFEEFIAESKTPVVRGERLDLKAGVEKQGARIAAIKMESGRVFRGRMFIDATYEGDLMALAGVRYHVGREANSVYGETLNGVQTQHDRYHQFHKPVDPYVEPGNPQSGLLPSVHNEGPGEEGSGDQRVQAYNFRLCMTNVPENRVPWPKPPGYDPLRYELLLRNFEAGDHALPCNPVRMPNVKTDTNNNHGFSTDHIGGNYEYPDGDYATRERIIQDHVVYQQGLMWTLANNPRVPEKVRSYFQAWGLAKDEFTDNDNWPHQLYIREARRMIGDYVVTEADCRWQRRCEDPVGLAAYTMDSHHTQRYVTPEGYVRNEGDVQVRPSGPYAISYRAIVPKAEECVNLFVPVCLSSSHIAFGSIRMEPVFMVLGQSAATAAALAIDDACDVQAIDYEKLQTRLLADKQILEWVGGGHGAIHLRKLPGVIVDDTQAQFTGEWSQSAALGPFVHAGYHHDGHQHPGQKQARFQTQLPAAGKYEVRLAYTPNANRASNVPVAIHHADGVATLEVNQRLTPPLDKAFLSLGVYRFTPNQPAALLLTNENTNGHVIADAVQFLPVKE